MYNITIKNHVQVFCVNILLFVLAKYLGVGLLGHMMNQFFIAAITNYYIFSKTAKNSYFTFLEVRGPK